MAFHFRRAAVILGLAGLIGCGSSTDGGSTSGSTSGTIGGTTTHGSSAGSTSATGSTNASISSGTTTAGSSGVSSSSTTTTTAGSTGTSSTSTSTGSTTSSSTTTTTGTSGTNAGWLYTTGNKIYVHDGSSGGTPWMGRGVNVDDIYLCGYDYTLWMTNPDQALETMYTGLIADWHPSFVRISLGMDSYPTVSSWLSDASQYSTPMTGVINALGANPGVYVLVSLRSEASMIGQDQGDGDPEATGLPSDSTSTPDASAFPTGTDATYVALVDTFANSNFVLFGLTNEPGGDTLSNAQISAAMGHAVGVIRAEEDRLGVPHHIVSVQGNGWTSDISFYDSSPLPYDNVVYEVHGYPPTSNEYTFNNIPVIIGEYGSLPDSAAFFADMEAKQIPNLAWDFDSYSDCQPDLLQVNQSSTNLSPSSWGSTVQAYLLAH